LVANNCSRPLRGYDNVSTVSLAVLPVAISLSLRHVFTFNTRAHKESTCIRLTQHRCALVIAQPQGQTTDSSGSFAYEMCPLAHTFRGRCVFQEMQGIVRKWPLRPLLSCVGLPASSWWPCSCPPLLFLINGLCWICRPFANALLGHASRHSHQCPEKVIPHSVSDHFA
jgi:hypothetical protein